MDSIHLNSTDILLFQELLERDDFHHDLDTFSKSQSADVVVIMTLVNDEEDRPNRQIAVYSPNRIFRDQVNCCHGNLFLVNFGIVQLIG